MDDLFSAERKPRIIGSSSSTKNNTSGNNVASK
jgi:hypothetical protein